MVEELILDPLTTVANSVVSVLPGLAAFIVIITVGLIVSWLVGRIIAGILRGTGFDRWYVKTGLDKTVGNIVPSSIVGAIINVWIFITFFAAATEILNLGPISLLLSDLSNWLPNAVVATLIVIFGWVAANVVGAKISKRGVEASEVLAFIAKVVIWIFTLLIAFAQIGIEISLAENTILIIVAGIMLGLAIAIGKGFGAVFEKKSDRILRFLGIRI